MSTCPSPGCKDISWAGDIPCFVCGRPVTPPAPVPPGEDDYEFDYYAYGVIG